MSAPTPNVQIPQSTLDGWVAQLTDYDARLQVVLAALRTAPPPPVLPSADTTGVDAAVSNIDTTVTDLEDFAGITPSSP